MLKVKKLEEANAKLKKIIENKAYESFKNTEMFQQNKAYENEIELLKARIKELELENERLNNFITQLQNDKLNLESKYDTLTDELNTNTNKFDALNKKYNTLNDNYLDMSEQQKYMVNQSNMYQDKIKRFENESKKYIQQIKGLEQQLSLLHDIKYKYEKDKIKLIQLQNDSNNFTIEKNKLLQEIDLLKTNETQNMDTINELRQEIEALKAKPVKQTDDTEFDNLHSDNPTVIFNGDNTQIESLIAEQETGDNKIIDNNPFNDETDTDMESKTTDHVNENGQHIQMLSQHLMMMNDEMKKQNENLLNQLKDLHTSLDTRHNEYKTIQNALNEEKQRNTDLSNNIERNMDEIQTLKGERDQLQSHIKRLEHELRDQKSINVEIGLKQSQNIADKDAMEAIIAELRRENNTLKTDKDRLLNELNDINAAVDDDDDDDVDDDEKDGDPITEIMSLQNRYSNDGSTEEATEFENQKGNMVSEQEDTSAMDAKNAELQKTLAKQKEYLDKFTKQVQIQIKHDQELAQELVRKEEEELRKQKSLREIQERRDAQLAMKIFNVQRKKSNKNVKQGSNNNIDPELRLKLMKQQIDAMKQYEMKNQKKKQGNQSSKSIDQLLGLDSEINNNNNNGNNDDNNMQAKPIVKAPVKKSQDILQLWIKSQLQLMCGELPTVCKKYGVKLKSLDEVLGRDKSKQFQPKISAPLHYLNFRHNDDRYDEANDDFYDDPSSVDHSNITPGAPLLTPGKSISISEPHNNNIESPNIIPSSPRSQLFEAIPNENSYNNNNNNNSMKHIKSMSELKLDDNSRNKLKTTSPKKKRKSLFGFGNKDKSDKKKKKEERLRLERERKLEREREEQRKKEERELERQRKREAKAERKKKKELKRKMKKQKKMNNAHDIENSISISAGIPNVDGGEMIKSDIIIDAGNSKQELGIISKQVADANEIVKQYASDNEINSNQNAYSQSAPPPAYGNYLLSNDLKTFSIVSPPVSHSGSNNNNNQDNTGSPNLFQSQSTEPESPTTAVNIPLNLNGNNSAKTIITNNSNNSKKFAFSNGLSNGNHSNGHPNKQPKLQFDPITEERVIGENIDLIIRAQFGKIKNKKNSTPTLKLSIKNISISNSINFLNITFDKNDSGITAPLNNLVIKGIQEHGKILNNETQSFNLPLLIKKNHSSIFSLGQSGKFNYNAKLKMSTNITSINCDVKIPLHLFFQDKGSIDRDKFLTIWKSIPQKHEAKYIIKKVRQKKLDFIKNLLKINKLFFIHHRSIPNKGDILYYSARMYGAILLSEISIALNGKGTIVVRSNDTFKSNLALHAIRFFIDVDAS